MDPRCWPLGLGESVSENATLAEDRRNRLGRSTQSGTANVNSFIFDWPKKGRAAGAKANANAVTARSQRLLQVLLPIQIETKDPLLGDLSEPSCAVLPRSPPRAATRQMRHRCIPSLRTGLRPSASRSHTRRTASLCPVQTRPASFRTTRERARQTGIPLDVCHHQRPCTI